MYTGHEYPPDFLIIGGMDFKRHTFFFELTFPVKNAKCLSNLLMPGNIE